MKFTWTETFCALSILLLAIGVMAFWLTVGYVAIHLVSKYW